MSFSSLHPALARALADRRYTELTPVQSAVLEAPAGRDLLVSAQTGSGKTVAYGLALGATLLGEAPTLGPAGQPLALIVAPTRELALQVERELRWLYEHAGARVVSCVGGMDPRREAFQLGEGAHIVVGTPGRLRDHIERRRLDVGALAAVVLDEADEMLDLGFSEDLEFILGATPPERRSLLFSATLPAPIVVLARTYQRDALRLSVAGAERGHADIDYRAIRVFPRELELAVVNLLRFHEAPSALVFCNTRNAVRHLEAVLLERGFLAVALSGELGQNERNAALQALRDGRARVCVATDVAARGIDLPGLDLVIHAELPHDAEVMQHRSGRTGRAGRKGVSALLVPPSRRRKAESLLATAGVAAEWGAAPTLDEIRVLDRERLLQDPLLTPDAAEDDAEMIDTLLAGRAPRDLAAALVRVYRARQPAAEEVGDPGFRVGETRPLRPARDGEGRAPRQAGPRGETVWFRLDIGRKQGADPRQLLPMLCRRGGITRDAVGAIRIFDRETKVEIDAGVAERFAAAVSEPDRDRITIAPVDGAPERRPAKPFAEKRAGREPPADRDDAPPAGLARPPRARKSAAAPRPARDAGPEERRPGTAKTFKAREDRDFAGEAPRKRAFAEKGKGPKRFGKDKDAGPRKGPAAGRTKRER